MTSIDSRDALVAALSRLGELERDMRAIETEVEERVARETAAGASLVQPLADRHAALLAEIQAYADTHRPELAGDKASVKLPSGTLAWRKGQPRVEISAEDEPAVLDALETLDAERFVRTKRSVIAKAVLDAGTSLPTIAGLTIRPAGETFKATPAKTAPLAA